MTTLTPNPSLVEKIVYANRILYDQGIVDGLGHVSVRDDKVPGVFLLSCNRAPALVTARDIVCYDLDGEAVSATAERPYLERFIHSEIYRARPDVIAVVHSHSANMIPFGVTGNRLRPIYHMAGFLGSGSTHFEIRDGAGDTDMLIRNGTLGKSLAQALGDSNCVLMRGHGSTVVGGSVEQVVYRAIYAEINAKLQARSLGMGEVNYLTPQEAGMAATANDGQIGRSWDLWCRRIGPIC